MTQVLARFVVMALIVGVVEAGLDDVSIVVPADQTGTAHEIHDHLGSDTDSPDGDGVDTDHYCHCVSHGAALAFSVIVSRITQSSPTLAFEPSAYHSLAIPPPVPPPNA